MKDDIVRDDAYYHELRHQVLGRGAWSSLFGTSRRSLDKAVRMLREAGEPRPPLLHLTARSRLARFLVAAGGQKADTTEPGSYPAPPADLVLRRSYELPRTRRRRQQAWQQWGREHWGRKENGQ